MANHIEDSGISPRRFVTVTSRYADSKVLYYTDRKLLTFNTYKKRPVTLSGKDKFLAVTKKYEYRPDLLSFDAYGTPDFWWKIMEANGVKDVYEFVAGLNIRLPDSIFI